MMKTKLVMLIALFWCFSSPALASPDSSAPAGGVCSLCHFCPHPYGFCVLIWAAAILLLLLIVTCLVGRKKKCPVCRARNKRRAEFCENCDYDFYGQEADLAVPLAQAVGDGLNPAVLPQPAPAKGGIWTDRSALANQPIPPAAKAQARRVAEATAPAPAARQYTEPLSMPAPRNQYTPALTAQAFGVPEDQYIPQPSPVPAKAKALQDSIPAAVKQAASPKPAAIPSAAERKPCPYCGKILPARALFCSECGNRLAAGR